MRLPTLQSYRRPVSLFDFSSPFDELFKGLDRNAEQWANFTPAIDIEEKDGTWHITADLPGLRKEDVKVEFHDGVLTISGERVKEAKGEGRYFERSYGRFVRSFNLPATVDAEKIDAKYENGVLHLSVPTAESKKAKTITIS